LSIDGKVAIVTGGSRGIGFETAKLFSENGAKVVITSKNSQNLKDATNQISNLLPIIADIRKEEDFSKNQTTT
jgi:NAD(P)-dependent dehydrogenase (short-subunit alcohol dehydrogenase family)